MDLLRFGETEFEWYYSFGRSINIDHDIRFLIIGDIDRKDGQWGPRTVFDTLSEDKQKYLQLEMGVNRVASELRWIRNGGLLSRI